jgi:hypothetical protein
MAESTRVQAAVLGAAFVLAACGVEAPDTPPNLNAPLAAEKGAAPVQQPSPPPPPAEALRGDWVLVSIDGAGQPPRADYVHLSISDGRIRAVSQCIPFRWRYAHGEGRLRIAQERPPGPVCLRPLSMWERQFEAGMAAARSIAIGADGKLEIAGPEGRLRFQRE